MFSEEKKEIKKICSMKKSKIILSEYQILNHLLTYKTRRVYSIQQSTIKIITLYLQKLSRNCYNLLYVVAHVGIISKNG